MSDIKSKTIFVFWNALTVGEKFRFLEFHLLLTFLCFAWAIGIIKMHNQDFFPNYPDIFLATYYFCQNGSWFQTTKWNKTTKWNVYVLSSFQLITMSSFSLYLVPEEARSACECFSEVKEGTKCWPLRWREECKTALKNKPKNVIRERKCWVKSINSLAFMLDSDIRNPALTT